MKWSQQRNCGLSRRDPILSNRSMFHWLVLLILTATCPVASSAQVVATTSVSGTIADAQGAAVVGAEISLTDTSTSVSQTTTSNDVGRYVFPVVQPGTYNMTVSKTGFSLAKVSNQTVAVGTPLTMNLVLSVGAATETVEVTATGTELQTLNATVGTTIQHQELLVMPNLTRDTSSLVTLQPGVTFGGNSAGAASDQNSFILDGGTITDDMSGDNNVYIPSFSGTVTGGKGLNGAAPSGVIPTPVESIEEFKTSVSGQTADFNSSAGSETVMATKKGTSKFHGSAYEYYQDTVVGGANSFDNNDAHLPIASAHYSRFGATAGGPITNRNFLGGKWFIFGNYEGFRDPQVVTETQNLPTPMLRSGLMFINGSIINLNNFATAVPKGMGANVYTAMNTAAGTMIPAQSAYCTTPGNGVTGGCPLGGGLFVAQGASITGSGGSLDPRNLGLNPVICNNPNLGNVNNSGACTSGLWSEIPVPNNYTQSSSTGNNAGYTSVLRLPQTSNFGVLRVDHDFGSKWHFFSTYHYYRLDRTTSNQLDIGGVFLGDQFGTWTSTSNRPQVPWFYTASVSTDLTTALTNQFTYSGTRNWWAYATNGGVPNLAGFPAAFEPGGETANDYAPFNTNNQSTRTRYWNGHDNQYGDNLTWLKGNHLLSIGGLYLHQHETHQRIDNGGSINIYEQYLMGDGTSIGFGSMGVGGTSAFTPGDVSSTGRYADYYSMITGLVDITQKLYTRNNGATLTAKPVGSCAISGIPQTAQCIAAPPAINSSVIQTYNLYISDSWKIKPSLTLTFGTGYTVETPPFEPSGNQDILVDTNGNPVDGILYLQEKNAAALQGQAFDPILGFDTVTNVKGKPKYPYNSYYNGMSPRVAIAWNPSSDSGFMGHLFGHNDTVVRAGWSRIYGRLNGVDQVLVPILAPGLMQTSICEGPTTAGTCGSTLVTNFRVGVDGTTAFNPPPSVNPGNALPQPWFPGVNDVSTGPGESLDPNFKPDRSDEFNLSVQRQLNRKIQFEIGYIGRIIRNEYQAYDLNAVPYNMTQGGETFAKAWANVVVATNFGQNLTNIPVQPFFEAALKSSYCSGFANCTTAFVKNEAGNMGCACVWDAWTDVSTTGDFTFGRSMLNDPTAPTGGLPASIGANGQDTDIFDNVSNGYGNYNAGYFTVSFSDWHGLSARSNFTYGRALGTGSRVQASSQFTEIDPFNNSNNYGLQPFSFKLLYNLYFRYDLPFFRNQQNVVGRILGGWSVTPLLTAGSGAPIQVGTSNGVAEAFGEGDTNFEGTYESAVLAGSLSNYTASAKRTSCGSGGIGVSSTCMNVFDNPANTINLFRNPVLGLDGHTAFPIYGLPFWNLDAAIQKDFKVTERVNASIYVSALNVLNHMQPSNPSLDLANPQEWGVLGGGGAVQSNSPRQMEWGVRVSW